MYCTNPECPDLESTGRPGEYVDGMVTCPVCGAALVEQVELEPEAADEPLEAVFETSDPAEVPVVKTVLDAAEIPYVVDGDRDWDAFRGGLAPFRFSNDAPRIVFSVPPGQAEEARALLQEVEERADTELPDGVLPPGCGGGCPGSC
jgi:hypothetical protein